MDAKKVHNSEIINQFTKQAIPFTQFKEHPDSIQVLISMSGVDSDDDVLDVACGPGIVLCEFAKWAKSAVGVDITPSMIDQAKRRQENLNLDNIKWEVGDVSSLLYKSNTFSLVVTRYSFHHFLNPSAVLEEMYRVCKPGGRIVIADIVVPKKNLPFYNEVEKLRDYSHVSGLTSDQIENLLTNIGLKNLRRSGCKVEMEQEKQLATSFPKKDDARKIRELFKKDLSENKLGLDVRLEGGVIHFSFPVSVYAGVK